MELFSTPVSWIYKAIDTCSMAAIIGGVLLLIGARFSWEREPSAADVRQAAERYRRYYGDQALAVIGDHMLAASFTPDGRHRRFLIRVIAALQIEC